MIANQGAGRHGETCQRQSASDALLQACDQGVPIVNAFADETESQREAEGYEHALRGLIQEGVNLLREVPLVPYIEHHMGAGQPHDGACTFPRASVQEHTHNKAYPID